MTNRQILALYLCLLAVRQGVNRVKLTNDCLKALLPRKRVSRATVTSLYKQLEPVFMSFTMGKEHSGTKNTAILVAAGTPESRTRGLVTVSRIPPVHEMKQELGLT